MPTSWKSVLTRGCLFLLLVFSGYATPADKIDFASLMPSDAVPGEILVKLRSDIPNRVNALASVNATVSLGGEVKHAFKTIPWQVVKFPSSVSLQAAADAYMNDPRVLAVEPNYIVHATATTPNDPSYGDLWGMTRIDAPLAWDITTGDSNIVVAVIDTGLLRTHEDLADNIWTNPGEIAGNGIDDDGNGYVDDVHGWDFFDDDNDPTDPAAGIGHGTHVSGTIGGVGNNALGVAGVNWNIRIVGVRFLGPEGGTTEDAIKAVEYVTSLAQYIRLSNNSWGGGGYSEALKEAIAQSGQSNQLFIAAAGNGGLDQIGDDNDSTPHYPSSYDLDNIIAVAAIDSSGALADFSNYGATSVDIAAPGVDILSTVSTSDSAYESKSGTSMACPHVAGAAALLWGMVGPVDYAIIREAIFMGAKPNAALSGQVATSGELNLWNALGTTVGVYPNDAYVATGAYGTGPFLPSNHVYTVFNLSTAAAPWHVSSDVAWLNVTPDMPTVPAFGTTGVVVEVDQSVAASLDEGVYIGQVTFEDLADSEANTTREAVLRVGSNYMMRATTYNWIDPVSSGHTEVAMGTGGNVVKALPFRVTYYGTEYSSAYVSGRGYLGFLEAGTYPGDNADIPDTAAPNAVISPYWDGLILNYQSRVYYGTVGQRPNRRLVVTWMNVSHKLDTSARFSFQAIIDEAPPKWFPDQDITFQYRDVDEDNATYGGGKSATIGIENAAGDMARRFSFNGSTPVSDGQALLFTLVPLAPDVTDPVPMLSIQSVSATQVVYDVYFNEPVTGLAQGDFVLSGTWPGAALAALTGSGQRYEITVTGSGGLGSVALRLNAGAAVDAAGNPSTAAGPVLYVVPSQRSVFSDNMDGGATTWTASTGTVGSVTRAGWEWGSPDPAYLWGPPNTPSGSNCWGTVLDGDYPANMDGWVQSADVSVGRNPVLAFKQWYFIESGYDAGYVEVYDGSSWSNVTPGGVYSGVSATWTSEQIVLDPAVFADRDIRVRFRLESDYSIEYSGLYIDDVKLIQDTEPGVWVVAYTPTNASPGSSVPLMLQAYNSTTQTLHNVQAALGPLGSGLTFSSSTVDYGDMAPGQIVTGSVVTATFGSAASFAGSPVYFSHVVTADSGSVGDDLLPIAIDGVSSGGSPKQLTASSSAGVVDWTGAPLAGDGSERSAWFQIIGTGSNLVADPPAVGGGVSGDDVLLVTSDELRPYGRIGTGASTVPDLGQFEKVFSHALGSNALVYARAWDGPSYATSVAYGDSAVQTLTGSTAEARDFGAWVVGTPIDMVRDLNGDSIPDGWDVLMGNDAKMPVSALTSGVTVEAVATGLNRPGRVCIWSNFVFVADTENNRVVVLSSDLSTVLSTVGSYGTGNGQFNSPQGVAVSEFATQLVVADTDNNRVQLFTINPASGALTYASQFGAFGSADGLFNAPYDVAVSQTSGKIFVADSHESGARNHRIQRFSSAGVHEATWSGYDRPLGVAIRGDRLYVAEQDNHRVRNTDLTGASPWEFGAYGSGDGQFATPRGVSAAIPGVLLVADTSNHRIQMLNIYNAPGTVTSFGAVGQLGSEQGQFRFPQGVCATADGGAIYVADTYNDRIQLISVVLDGDGDGMDDVWEAMNGLDPTDPNDWDDDPDGDGVTNIGEYRIGTDPQNGDSNGNGGSDGFELGLGRDPLQVPGYDLLMIRDLTVTSPAVDFNVISGGVYQIETRTNLLEGGWSTLGGAVTGSSDGVLSVPVPVVDPPRFYRIKKTN